MRPLIAPALAMALLLGAGCQHPRGTFAMIAPEALPGQYRTVFEGRVWGQQCATPSQLFLDLAQARTMYSEAARQALAQAPGANALRDATFWFVRTPFWVWCARVEGLPVTLRPAEPAPPAAEPKEVSR